MNYFEMFALSVCFLYSLLFSTIFSDFFPGNCYPPDPSEAFKLFSWGGCSAPIEFNVWRAKEMATNDPQNETTELACVEETLMSLEKLDRASPDLWPEQIPGVNEFIAQNLPPTDQGSWSTALTSDDLNQLHQLGNLTVTSLIAEVKKLHDEAYQLGLEEAKEMTRGKYLNIFKNNK
uniref:Lin52_0 protein n=2 Tax=Fopius arisanus TaxID=64838 RepID=A0A0C9RDZ9_9HYME